MKNMVQTARPSITFTVGLSAPKGLLGHVPIAIKWIMKKNRFCSRCDVREEWNLSTLWSVSIFPQVPHVEHIVLFTKDLQ